MADRSGIVGALLMISGLSLQLFSWYLGAGAFYTYGFGEITEFFGFIILVIRALSLMKESKRNTRVQGVLLIIGGFFVILGVNARYVLNPNLNQTTNLAGMGMEFLGAIVLLALLFQKR